jgi:Tol biopolymer transport system component
MELESQKVENITTIDGSFVRIRYLNSSDEVVLAECAQACAISILNLRTLRTEEYADLVFGWAFEVIPNKRAIAIEASSGFLGLVPCNDAACNLPSGIYEFDLDTRNYHPLVLDDDLGQRVTEPDISFDNTFLVFQAADVELKNLSTGELKSLTSGSVPSWRQLGGMSSGPSSQEWVAFRNDGNLWIIQRDGTERRSVTTSSTSISPTAEVLDYKWSPDGKTLAYSMGSKIYLYDMQTLESISFETGGAGAFDWSPDGKQLIYDAPFSEGNPWSNNGLWVLSIENGRSRQIVAPTTEILGFRAPQWSADGSHVLFYIPSVFSPTYQTPSYGVANITTGKSVRLPISLVEGQTSGSCRWAPTDLIIACASGRNENAKKADLMMMDVGGHITKRISLTENMQFPMLRWSSDGSRIAIGYYDHDNAQTAVLTLNTEGFTTLASGLPSEWSPSGQELLVWEGNPDGNPRISIIDVDSGDIQYSFQGIEGIWQP